jgi:isoleucyl-tRNA synthetase
LLYIGVLLHVAEYMAQKEKYIIDKYHDIIAEELNVKQVAVLDSGIVVKKVYKPLGNKLSAKFGKDTGRVIQLGKQGNTRALPNGQLVIFDEKKNEWLLEADDYDVDYEGLDEDTMAADTGIVVSYDMHITPELAQEGIAREISRFLNQMRKDADFAVEKKAICQYHTDAPVLQEAIVQWQDFLIQEALLSEITPHKAPKGSHTATFVIDE